MVASSQRRGRFAGYGTDNVSTGAHQGFLVACNGAEHARPASAASGSCSRPRDMLQARRARSAPRSDWHARAKGGAFPQGGARAGACAGAPASLPKAVAYSAVEAAGRDGLFGVRQHVASAGERYRTKGQTKSARNRKSGPECPKLGGALN
jgi:hypothetical protein